MAEQERTELEIVEEFHAFLMGLLPEGVVVPKKPKMSVRRAFSVIWFLQAVSRLVPDHFELCDQCKRIYDSDDDGGYDEQRGKSFCSESCEVEGLMPARRRSRS